MSISLSSILHKDDLMLSSWVTYLSSSSPLLLALLPPQQTPVPVGLCLRTEETDSTSKSQDTNPQYTPIIRHAQTPAPTLKEGAREPKEVLGKEPGFGVGQEGGGRARAGKDELHLSYVTRHSLLALPAAQAQASYSRQTPATLRSLHKSSSTVSSSPTPKAHKSHLPRA